MSGNELLEKKVLELEKKVDEVINEYLQIQLQLKQDIEDLKERVAKLEQFIERYAIEEKSSHD